MVPKLLSQFRRDRRDSGRQPARAAVALHNNRQSGRDMHANRTQDNATELSAPGRSPQLNRPRLPSRTLIDGAVQLTGDLWSEGDVQIDGHVCGNINCVQLIISKDAVVTGSVVAHEAVVRGKLTGIIRATRVLLQETARVECEILYRMLSVEEGARFEGVARSRPDPLQEEFALSPMAELRQQMALAQPALPGAGATGIKSELRAPNDQAGRDEVGRKEQAVVKAQAASKAHAAVKEDVGL